MEAIAGGVRARLEESTGFSRRVTEETIRIARALGVSEEEIERWSSRRRQYLTGETARLLSFKDILDRIKYGVVYPERTDEDDD
jgi:hypothetical protein